jgi:hypothetical protein
VNTAPLFAVVLSRVFLHERPPVVVQVAIPVAFAGAALIALGDWTGSPGSLLGNGLAVAGAVTLAAYQVVGRGLRDALPLDAYVLAVWGTAALALLALALSFGVPLGGYPGRTWLLFVALAIVPTIGGHGLVNKSVRSLPAPTVGLFLLGEPVIASLLAWLLLREAPGPWTLAGGAVVLGRARPRPREAPMSERAVVHVLFTGGTISMRRDPATGAALPPSRGARSSRASRGCAGRPASAWRTSPACPGPTSPPRGCGACDAASRRSSTTRASTGS